MNRFIARLSEIAFALLACGPLTVIAQPVTSSTPELTAARFAISTLEDVPRVGFNRQVYNAFMSGTSEQVDWPDTMLRQIASIARVSVASNDSLNPCAGRDRCAFRGVGAIVSLARPVVTGARAVVQVGIERETAPSQRKGQYLRQYRYILERSSEGWRVTSSVLEWNLR